MYRRASRHSTATLPHPLLTFWHQWAEPLEGRKKYVRDSLFFFIFLKVYPYNSLSQSVALQWVRRENVCFSFYSRRALVHPKVVFFFFLPLYYRAATQASAKCLKIHSHAKMQRVFLPFSEAPSETLLQRVLPSESIKQPIKNCLDDSDGKEKNNDKKTSRVLSIFQYSFLILVQTKYQSLFCYGL